MYVLYVTWPSYRHVVYTINVLEIFYLRLFLNRELIHKKKKTNCCYRWKGENVSTTEVEAVISKITGYRVCVVYGVEV